MPTNPDDKLEFPSYNFEYHERRLDHSENLKRGKETALGCFVMCCIVAVGVYVCYAVVHTTICLIQEAAQYLS